MGHAREENHPGPTKFGLGGDTSSGLLSAELNEARVVLRGTASLLGKREVAPAHSIHPERELFDVGWLCPFCGRNTMRSFAASALLRVTKRSA
mgnify:CR=1 FL=1